MTRIIELRYPKDDIRKIDYETAPEIMKKLGFDFLGHGDFGSVYEHPGLNYVIKVFVSADNCYQDFVKIAMKHQSNPHFPKFRGKMIGIADGMMGIRMEKLSPIVSNDQTMVRRDIDYRLRSMYPIRKKFLKQFPLLEKACAILINAQGDSCRVDSNPKNVMFRGEIPVIIDPWMEPKAYW